MPKLKVEDLEKISESAKAAIFLREGAGRVKIIVHLGTCGIAAGARNIMNALLKVVEETGVRDVIVTTSGCAGLCSREPMVTVEIKGEAPVKYVDLTEAKIRRIFFDHIIDGKIVIEYALAIGSETEA